MLQSYIFTIFALIFSNKATLIKNRESIKTIFYEIYIIIFSAQQQIEHSF